MTRLKLHTERHLVSRIGWLRAAVLGANDGLISTASLIVGVAASAASVQVVLAAGVAGLMAGALSMAAGEYVSVSSQADTEKADLARESAELQTQPEFELAELTDTYVQRGVAPELALQVAQQMTAAGALAAHARDELGIFEHSLARPLQAAITSALTFTAGAALPLAVAVLVPFVWLVPAVAVTSLILLGVLGATGASLGGAPLLRATLRVLVWGAIAMGVTALVGQLFGVVAA